MREPRRARWQRGSAGRHACGDDEPCPANTSFGRAATAWREREITMNVVAVAASDRNDVLAGATERERAVALFVVA